MSGPFATGWLPQRRIDQKKKSLFAKPRAPKHDEGGEIKVSLFFSPLRSFPSSLGALILLSAPEPMASCLIGCGPGGSVRGFSNVSL